MKRRRLSRRALPIGLAAGLLLIALVGWFGLIAPQHSKASSLKREIDATESQIRSLELRPTGASTVKAVKVADIFRLSKAIPDKLQMSDVLLELNRVAGESGITFESITPHAPTPETNYQSVPIDVVFHGNYYDLSDFLYRLRNLVEVHDGYLQTTGRLFTVDHLMFGQGEKPFPQVKATLGIVAYIYGGGLPPTGPDASAGTTSTSTSGTTTSSTTTSAPTTTGQAPATSTPPSGATAVGATP